LISGIRGTGGEKGGAATVQNRPCFRCFNYIWKKQPENAKICHRAKSFKYKTEGNTGVNMEGNSRETTESTHNNILNRKSVKNLYDGNTGFSLMINLYVIKYIYYHISKAQCFMDEDGQGTKKKSIPIYSSPYFPMSRQRLDRINKGGSFELTHGEAESITTAYGIDIKYFRKDDPQAFVINGIDETDWKCFYNSHYYGNYGLSADLRGNEKKIEENATKVTNVLKELSENWEDTLEKDDPVFAICHYFHYGQRFDRPNAIKELRDILSSLDYGEWEKENGTSLNEMWKLLRNHFNYVNSLYTLKKLRKEQLPQKLTKNQAKDLSKSET